MMIIQVLGPNASYAGFAVHPDGSSTPRTQKIQHRNTQKIGAGTSIYVSIKSIPDRLFCAACAEF
jgi:hypothetical protein